MRTGPRILKPLALLLWVLPLAAGAYVALTQWNVVLESRREVSRTFESLAGLERLRAALTAAEAAQRSFLLTGNNEFLYFFADASEASGHELDQLRRLDVSLPSDVRRLRQISDLRARRIEHLQAQIDARRANGAVPGKAELEDETGELRRVRSELSAAVKILRDDKEQLLAERRRVEEDESRRVMIMLFACALGTGLFAAVGASIIIRDIRRRTVAEEELRESNRRLSLAVEAGGIGVWLWDMGTNAFVVDERMRAHLGVGDATGFGGTYRDFLELIGPENVDRHKAALAAALVEGRRYQLEYKLPREGGGERRVVANAEIERDDVGRPLKLCGVALDVTENRVQMDQLCRLHAALTESTSVLRGVIDSSGDLIAAVDSEYRFLTFNQAYREMAEREYGVSLRLGMPLRELLERTPPGRKDRRPLWERAMHGDTFTVVDEHILEDGTTRAQELRLSPLRDASGQIRGAAKTIRDVTQRVAHERDLRAARETAEGASKAKSEFLAHVSHELRTPLSAVIGFADLILSGNEPPEERFAYASKIRSNAQSLVELINDLLDLTRIEEGRVELERVAFQPLDLAHDVRDLFALRAQQSGLELDVVLGPGIPRLVLADPIRVRQVLVNLVGNAVKFTQRGNVTIALSAGEDPAAGATTLAFEVRDTGIGMSAEGRKRIFRAFGQADASVSRRFGGSGLGLALSRRLAGLMGGELELVTSAPGKGSIFRFTVPVECVAEWTSQRAAFRVGGVEEEKEKAATISAIAAPAPSDDLSGLRLLLVEDAPDNRFLATRTLQSLGAQVDAVADGQAGLDAAAKNIYDAVLLDLELPDMPGFEVAEKLAATGMRIPVVALTAHPPATVREQCLARGFSAFLSKPLDATEMVQVLREATLPVAAATVH